MTQRTEGPDLRRHLRELEARVERIERANRVRPTSQRPRPPVMAETWTEPTLPTTDLRRGRMVYATNLSAGVIWNNVIYVVDDLDQWRLLTAFQVESTLVNSVTTPDAARYLPRDLGTPPCKVEVHATLTGCAEAATSNTWGYEGVANLHRQGTSTLLRRVCVWCPGLPGSGVAARPTGSGHYLEERNETGGAITYDVKFEDNGGPVKFIGSNESINGGSDHWKLLVQVL